MNDTNLNELSALDTFAQGVPLKTFSPSEKTETYRWIRDTLQKFAYRKLRKGERGKVRAFIQTVTSYSTSQLSRLIKSSMSGKLKSVPYRRNSFVSRYTPKDIALLCKTDNFHGRLNGHATKEILRREYDEFHQKSYERISHLSVAHLYRLRATRTYESKSLTYTKTQAVQRNIVKCPFFGHSFYE